MNTDETLHERLKDLERREASRANISDRVLALENAITRVIEALAALEDRKNLEAVKVRRLAGLVEKIGLGYWETEIREELRKMKEGLWT